MKRTLSLDLRTRIVETYNQGGFTRQQVADRFKVSLAMVKKLLQQARRLGHLNNLHKNSGRPRVIGPEEDRKLAAIHAQQSDATLKEYHERLGVACHISTIHLALSRLGLRFKKKS
jgi:transposase